MVQIAAVASGENLRTVGLRQLPENIKDVFPSGGPPRHACLVEFMLDLRHRISISIFHGFIQGQCALLRRMHVVVRAHPRGASLRPRAPEAPRGCARTTTRSEEHTSELQS